MNDEFTVHAKSVKQLSTAVNKIHILIHSNQINELKSTTIQRQRYKEHNQTNELKSKHKDIWTAKVVKGL